MVLLSASRLACLTFWILLVDTGAADEAAPPKPTAQPEPRMSFLENAEIKVGVDLSLGGAITWLSGRDGQNRVNNHDLGRQIQLSYYSGPVPFETGGQKPSAHWRHLGWNPIQAGDDFDNGSQVLEHRNDGREIYVKCVPLQWPLNRVPGDCTQESWMQLDGPVLKARARLVIARSDLTQYPARIQELPALYANAAFHRVVSYTGDRPFLGDAVQTLPPSTSSHPWSFWFGTEHWSAVLDAQEQGLGLITPGRVWFTGGFAGKPGPNDTKTNATGYLASQGHEILDHNIVHEFRYEVVVGSLEQIRARAALHAVQSPPAWHFQRDRQGWHYRDARDSGWPIKDQLDLRADGADPQLLSPPILWQAEDAPFVVIEAAFHTREPFASLYWRRFSKEAPGADDHLRFPVINDGQFHRYVIRLSDAASYTGPLIQLRLDPVSSGSPTDRIRLKSIQLLRQAP